MFSPTTLFLFVSALSIATVKSEGYRGFNAVLPAPIAVSDHTATVFPATLFGTSARIYVVGGCDSAQTCPAGGYCSCPSVTAKCNYYTPGSNTWTVCADLPRARHRHAAASFNSKLYLFGGRTAADAVITPVDVYDPVQNTWAGTPVTWAGAASDLTAFVEGAHIYIAGGWSAAWAPLATLTKFTPSNGTFSAMAAMPGGGRGDLSAVTVPKDSADLTKGSYHYVVGGFGASACEPLGTVESYDVATNAWTTRQPLALTRGDLAIGFIGTHMFAIAGETKDATCNATSGNPGNSIPVNDVERLDQAGSTLGAWVVEEEIPSNRFRFVAASYKAQIFLFGGQGLMNMTSRTYTPTTTTMLYVPKSVADARDDTATIAAGVIAGLAVLGVVVFMGISYGAYARWQGYTEAPDEAGQPPAAVEPAADDMSKKEEEGEGSVAEVDLEAAPAKA